MEKPNVRMNFQGARMFKDEEAAKAYYRKHGLTEEQIAEFHFLSAQNVPLRIRRKAMKDESMKKPKLTRNQRRTLYRRLEKGG